MKSLDQDGILRVSPSPIYALLKVLPIIFLCITILILAALYLDLLSIISVILAFVVLYKYWFIRTTLFVLDANTLRITTGIITKKTDHLELFRVKDLSFQQGISARIFGYIELTLYTSDFTSGLIRLRGIPKNLSLPDIIQDAVRSARIKNKSFEIELNN